jgi:hypothetical protein
MVFTGNMRSSRQEQVGGAGLSEVSAAFERLGWGVVENAHHDLGTDLLVFARDERRFDLGLLVGVQVKAGSTYFREPVHDEDGGLLGWWFRDRDRRHLEAWASFGVPFLIVLHDLDTRTSYWGHVTAEAVLPTGKGGKVLIRCANTVDDEHREGLLRVARTSQPTVAWEGSAWKGAGPVAQRDLLRHALLVPRLVAPHPNAGHDLSLAPEQAIALLVQARVTDLMAFAAERNDVPSLEEAARSLQWSWRFMSALGRRVTTGEVEALQLVVDDAPDSASRVASIVVAAAGLLEEGRADEAIALIEPELRRDDAEPVDYAWLKVQHARACAEVGRLDEARTAALDVQKVRMTHPGDVTATALAGVAALLLFSTSAWGQRDVADVVTDMDTTAAWWRAQTMSSGLAAFVERAFKKWARDTAITFGDSDAANDQLLAVSLMAGFAGDQSGWRHASALLARHSLLQMGSNRDVENARRALETLRLAGDEDSLKLATRRLAADGPAAAITVAAADVHLDASTRTSGPTDLALLQHGGDLLDEETADRTADWLLSTLSEPSLFATRTSPSYLLDLRLVDTLAGVVPAASLTAEVAVIDYLSALGNQEDQLMARAWARVTLALHEDSWSEEAALEIGHRASGHQEELRLQLLGVAARFDPSSRAVLLEEARNGSLQALGALGDVRILSTEVVADLISELAERVYGQIQGARAGAFGLGGPDFGSALALLSVWHPTVAEWEALFNLLEDAAVAGHQKQGAMVALTRLAEHLPDSVRSRLKGIALAVATQEASSDVRSLFGKDSDPRGAASNLAAALGAFDDDQSADRLLDLLAGDLEDRVWGVRLARRLGRREDVGVFLVLAQDVEPEVRAAAAGALAELVAEERGGVLAITGLQRCLRDPGARVPRSIALTFAAAPALGPAAEEAVAFLRHHPSACVRAITERTRTRSQIG